jgi:uncharacterized membrane protein YjjP (DUF1212 family)
VSGPGLTGSDDRPQYEGSADPAALRRLLLRLGAALTMTGDAVSEVQGHLRSVAAAYGYAHTRIAVFPTLLIVALGRGESAGFTTIDSARQLRLDQASEVIRVARAAQARRITPADALAELERILAMPSRFGTAAYVISHGVSPLASGSSSGQPPWTCGSTPHSAQPSGL